MVTVKLEQEKKILPMQSLWPYCSGFNLLRFTMEMWQLRQKHQEVIDKMGPEEGVHRAKSGFVTRFEGNKVAEHLKKMGHSTIGFDSCSCKEGK